MSAEHRIIEVVIGPTELDTAIMAAEGLQLLMDEHSPALAAAVRVASVVGEQTPTGIVRAERDKLRATFGGGLVPFDNAYVDAIRRGRPLIEAQQIGVDATLDAFVASVCRRLP